MRSSRGPSCQLATGNINTVKHLLPRHLIRGYMLRNSAVYSVEHCWWFAHCRNEGGDKKLGSPLTAPVYVHHRSCIAPRGCCGVRSRALLNARGCCGNLPNSFSPHSFLPPLLRGSLYFGSIVFTFEPKYSGMRSKYSEIEKKIMAEGGLTVCTHYQIIRFVAGYDIRDEKVMHMSNPAN